MELLCFSIIKYMQSLLLSVLQPGRRNYRLQSLYPSLPQSFPEVERKDTQVNNIPFTLFLSDKSKPCLLYIHSYNSNRLQVNSLIPRALKQQYNIAALDMQRIRYDRQTQQKQLHPDGTISFGHYQCDQVHEVVEWLRDNVNKDVFIWGRSMGAVTALLYQTKYQQARALVLDSPFHSLKTTFVKQLTNMVAGIPLCLSEILVCIAGRSFHNLLGFYIEELDIVQKMKIKCPCLIVVNPNDALAGQSGKLIYDKCQGIKKMFYSQAQHSANRQTVLMDQIWQNLNEIRKSNKIKYFMKRPEAQKTEYLVTQQKASNIKAKKKNPRFYLSLMQVKSDSSLLAKHREK